MNLIFKSFFSVAFAISVYFTSDTIVNYAFSKGLPQLPNTVAYFVSQSGLDAAISLYLSIITAGWVAKQLLSYIKTF